MKPTYDLSKARRGPLIPKDPSKTLISIPIENRALDYIEQMIDSSGGGSLENLFNTVLGDLVSLCQRAPVQAKKDFVKQAAHAALPGAFKTLAQVAKKPPPSNPRIAVPRRARAHPKKSAAIVGK